MSKPRVLFVDAYDSFTNNIVSLLEVELLVEVVQVKIDHVVPDLPSFLKQFVAVVCGPGPGHPANARDVGIFQDLWMLSNDAILPVLGICLGFQSLVHTFGGTVLPLQCPRHGISTKISSRGTSIFRGLESFSSIQYHSLEATLGHHDEGESTCSTLDEWEITERCPNLEPLAWEFVDPADKNVFRASTKPVLMAVKHVSRPFYGIQFHPESICSDPRAKIVVGNWWSEVQDWHAIREISNITNGPVSLCKDAEQFFRALDTNTLKEPRLSASSSIYWSSPCSSRTSSCASLSSDLSLLSLGKDIKTTRKQPMRLYTQTMSLGNLSVPSICEILPVSQEECVVLDSENRQMPEVGRYSIIGLVSRDTIHHNYSIGSNQVRIESASSTDVKDLSLYGNDIFTYLKSLVEEYHPVDQYPDIPFWGGLMGYITYEACVETIKITLKESQGHTDISFAFVERSIVVDHVQNTIYVQSIKQDDQRWVHSTLDTLAKIQPLRDRIFRADPSAKHSPPTTATFISPPSEPSYKSKIRACRDLINIGESYELCLTDQTTVRQKHNVSTPWALYLQLRRLNPAPFAAYVRLGSLTLLSSSPERFMSWTRPRSQAGKAPISICQLRPIKGTVQKCQVGPNGKFRNVTLKEATQQLSTTKERAENLMIVDLIRHDLHSVVGSGNVHVKKLMAVEEYETVYQLVSVIEGELKSDIEKPPSSDKAPHPAKHGIDVLAASLPPGSMTGAPKKRSCQLLRSIEDEKPRSIYSGVVGYISVGGGGDFSVVIRSMFKWDGEEGVDEWHVGAGGAVTTLSTEDGEWEEMRVKMESTLRVFRE